MSKGSNSWRYFTAIFSKFTEKIDWGTKIKPAIVFQGSLMNQEMI